MLMNAGGVSIFVPAGGGGAAITPFFLQLQIDI
jgi:hypothetical protein